METKKPIQVANYAAFLPIDAGERKYRIINDNAGTEVGIEVVGKVTDFNAVNLNGQKFDKKSYDIYISEYFEKNELNIPIDLMHVRDMQHLAGVAKKFVKKDGGVEVTAFIPRGAYFYNLIKVAIDNGMLQGFSNYGWIADWDYDRATDTCIVKEFHLISISLVDVPADVSSKFVGNATCFEGFDNEMPVKKSESIFDLI